MYASYTHFRVKKWWSFLLFQLHAARSYGQAKKAIGLQKIQTMHGGGMNFLTLSIWDSQEDMLRFRNSGKHLIAMKLTTKMGEGYAVGWECKNFPDKTEGEIRLKEKMTNLKLEGWLLA
jgi:heme-degrading monooxygenase HmoA